jgi:hypothetical protein
MYKLIVIQFITLARAFSQVAGNGTKSLTAMPMTTSSTLRSGKRWRRHGGWSAVRRIADVSGNHAA